MTIGGWITMCVSMSLFGGLFFFCMRKVLSDDKNAAQKCPEKLENNI